MRNREKFLFLRNLDLEKLYYQLILLKVLLLFPISHMVSTSFSNNCFYISGEYITIIFIIHFSHILVVDFCLTKTMVVHPETKYESLELQWATHVNCTQRAGRVGRVTDGRVYRFVTTRFYEVNLMQLLALTHIYTSFSRILRVFGHLQQSLF